MGQAESGGVGGFGGAGSERRGGGGGCYEFTQFGTCLHEPQKKKPCMYNHDNISASYPCGFLRTASTRGDDLYKLPSDAFLLREGGHMGKVTKEGEGGGCRGIGRGSEKGESATTGQRENEGTGSAAQRSQPDEQPAAVVRYPRRGPWRGVRVGH